MTLTRFPGIDMRTPGRKSFRLPGLIVSLIVGVWLLLCTNPQVYFYILLAPHKIVLYMDILDVDEDIFYYYQSPERGSDQEFVFQEEVKRDGVKKGKSFLKSKALQLVYHLSDAMPLFRPSYQWICILHEKPELISPSVKPVFHPPEIYI